MAENHEADHTDAKKGKKTQMGHVVLIHGICGGAWCWYKIKSLLEISGYKATCLDLMGAGIDPTNSDSILSFEDYNRPLDEFMTALPEGEKVVLVGHSAGGLSVTKASHKYPNKVQGAVYVAATMLELGFQSLEDMRIGAPDLSELGDIFEYQYALGCDRPPTSALFKKEFLRKLVYPMSPFEDYTLAAMLSRPGPVLATSTARFGRSEEEARGNDDDDDFNKMQVHDNVVPRVYIKTRLDKLLKKEQQEAMIEKWQPSEVYEVDTDHSPFFSNPYVLFGLLLKAAHLFTSPPN